MTASSWSAATVRPTTGSGARDAQVRQHLARAAERRRTADTSSEPRRRVPRVFPMATPILIVDDSAVSRTMIIRSLPAGWDVAITQAANGQEALVALQQKAHAVVLLDLNM